MVDIVNRWTMKQHLNASAKKAMEVGPHSNTGSQLQGQTPYIKMDRASVRNPYISRKYKRSKQIQ